MNENWVTEREGENIDKKPRFSMRIELTVIHNDNYYYDVKATKKNEIKYNSVRDNDRYNRLNTQVMHKRKLNELINWMRMSTRSSYSIITR